MVGDILDGRARYECEGAGLDLNRKLGQNRRASFSADRLLRLCTHRRLGLFSMPVIGFWGGGISWVVGCNTYGG